MTKTYLKDLIDQVNGCAIAVHRHRGPSLLEGIDHSCLKKGLRCDLFVKKSIVVELQAIKKALPIHKAKILAYRKLLEILIGLLVNYNVSHIFNKGQKTYINEQYRFLHD